MNTSIITIIIAIGLFFNTSKLAKQVVENNIYGKQTTNGTFIVDQNKSVINWIGLKPTGSHNGTILIKNGEIKVTDGDIKQGSFVIDMKTIVCLDIKNAGSNEKLVGHLNSPDFFDVEKHSESVFTILTVEKYPSPKNVENLTITHKISGNLKIKDITRFITFDARIDINENIIEAVTPKFSINRVDWGIKYNSKSVFKSLTDNIINDNFDLTIKLTANYKN